MTETERLKEIADKLQVIVTAYNAGQITIRQAATYKRKKPANGHVWYKITYIADRKYVYDGAYEMKISAQTELKDHLHNFLLYQLATVL